MIPVTGYIRAGKIVLGPYNEAAWSEFMRARTLVNEYYAG